MQSQTVDLQRYRATSGERNFIKQINVPIFLEAVETMYLDNVIQRNRDNVKTLI